MAFIVLRERVVLNLSARLNDTHISSCPEILQHLFRTRLAFHDFVKSHADMSSWDAYNTMMLRQCSHDRWVRVLARIDYSSRKQHLSQHYLNFITHINV